MRGAQLADSEMRSVLDLFRRAANVLARLEDAVVFRGLVPNFFPPPPTVNPPFLAVFGLPRIWEILGGEVTPGLLATRPSSASALNRAASAPGGKPVEDEG